MRLTPALALLAYFLAASAVGVVASHHHGGHGHRHGHAPAHIHRRSCQLHQKRDGGDTTTPAPQPLFAPAGPGDDSAVKKDKKKGKCALKKQKQKDQGQEVADEGLKGSGGPPVTGVPSLEGGDDGTKPPVTGVPSLGGKDDGTKPPVTGVPSLGGKDDGTKPPVTGVPSLEGGDDGTKPPVTGVPSLEGEGDGTKPPVTGVPSLGGKDDGTKPPVTGVPSLEGGDDGTKPPVTGVPSLEGEGDGAQPSTDGSSGVKKDKKGKCALKKQKQKDQGQEAADEGLKGSGGPPVTGVPSLEGEDDGTKPPVTGVPSLGGKDDGTKPPVTGMPSLGGEGDGTKPFTDGSSSAAPQPSRDSVSGDYSTGGQSGGNGSSDTGAGANRGSNPGGSSSTDDNVGFPGQTGTEGSEGQNPESYGTPPSGYASTPTPNTPHITPSTGGVTRNHVKCKGIRGSTFLSSTRTFKPHQFSPEFIYHGPGTTFGSETGFWKGGACMFDDLPHANLPSVAMDQTFFQDGLACGTCVEIASTSASLFSNDAVWTVETPKVGKLRPGKKTVAIVSDLCPGVEQCFSGLDMHLDAWNSVTSHANGSKLPINWKFVNCKQAFQKSGSGGKNLEIHWRPGANAGYFQVQVRGSHEAVVRMEMKVSGKGWSVAKHVDNSWWKWDGDATSAVKDHTAVLFRVTDWQGQTITSEVGTVIGKDLVFEANFDRVGGESQPEGYEA
ncbi:hypothetical protein NDA14_000672 [Ustilago hordei]|nr:hypothetical protein NDA14_000672 [Ustilago hordei]